MLRTRIGVMVPSTNTTLGGNLARVPPPAVTLHSHRLWMTNDANDDEAFAQVNDAIETAARYFGTARRDVVAYGCTRRLEAPAGREMPALMCAGGGHQSRRGRGPAGFPRAAHLGRDALPPMEQPAAPTVLREGGLRGPQRRR